MQGTSVTGTANPLVAQYTISTTGAATVSVEFGPTTSYGFQTSSQAIPSGGGTAKIFVAGMMQNTQYHMRADMNTSSGQSFDEDHTFTTGAIPAALMPQMQVTIPPGQQPTPGIQLVSFSGEAFAIDTMGNIIWYYNNPTGVAPYLVKLLPDGNILMGLNFTGPPASTGIREIDLAGSTLRELDLDTLSQKLHTAGYNLNLYSIDHDVLLLPNGHLLFIVSNTRVFTDLPGYPGQTTVVGNAVVDVDQNNNPVWVWDAFDHLDVNRHPINFPDWTHSNALFYIPDDGSILLSMRHQHWILKIDYANGNGAGDIIWKLGHEGDFALLNSDSPADWFYAQHDANIIGPALTGNFQLALFDNGDYRVLDDGGDTCGTTGQPACYSTSAIFSVDEADRTAQRGWTNQLPYSFWGGSVQQLTNTNMFVNETAPADLGANTSRVSEWTQQTNPTLLWQMQFNNHTAYRTLHMGSLYPGVQW